MYVSDRHLHDLLPRLEVTAEDGSDPFNANDQVQPASIDFRLSRVFWKPRWRRLGVDLRRARLLEIEPRRYYRRTELKFGEIITLKPRELLLGRTLEEFSVPNGYAAELTGRSSFARIGLMVSATGGFINPGWKGRMPLQLVNFSPNTIKLFPGLPICQVRFVKLTSEADRPYGHPELQSKYLNDDGGPSYWWRDKRIKELHALLSEKHVLVGIQSEIEEVIGRCEPEIVERLEEMIGTIQVGELESADSILHRFSEKEDRRRVLRRWAIGISRASVAVGITTSLWVLNKPPFRWWHYSVWCVSLLLFCLSMYAFRTEVGEHFGAAELRTKGRL